MKVELKLPKGKFYVKEEEIPITKTRKELLKKFFKKLPPTYYKNGKQQCKNHANRSISDLLVIVRERFPKTTISGLLRILCILNEKGMCYIVWCKQTKKYVMKTGKQNSLFSPWTIANCMGLKASDGLSSDTIIKAKKQYYDNYKNE